jgi:hypothetical protein
MKIWERLPRQLGKDCRKSDLSIVNILERRGRAEKLLKELAAAMDQHRSAMEKSIFHMEEYRKLILSAEEQQLLQSIPSRWVAESSNAVAQQNAAAELLQKLKALT